MAKQPYIPLYTGDYLKDTRTLTLAAKGAWMDLIIFMWGAEERGMLAGRNSDFARMVGATPDEFAAVLLELCLKRICDKTDLGGGNFKLVCRRMIREAEISAKKALNGSKGGSKTQANRAAKNEQIPDNDIAIDNEDEFKKDSFIENFQTAFDERILEAYAMQYKHLDVSDELQQFRLKCDNDPLTYHARDPGGLRNAFQYQLKTTQKPQTNGTNLSRKQQQLNRLVEDHEREFGGS